MRQPPTLPVADAAEVGTGVPAGPRLAHPHRTMEGVAIEPVRPTVLEVDLDAIRHNVGRLIEVAAGALVCVVVKADGYGHGAVAVSRAALAVGASRLAVALVEEGEVLRAAGIDAPILLLSEPTSMTDPSARETAVARLLAVDLTPSVCTARFADDLAAVAGRPVPVHLMVDTGMGRVGVDPSEVAALVAHPGLEVTGVWTHLARADEDVSTNAEQLNLFAKVLEVVRRQWPDALAHADNSAGTFRVADGRLDMVRAGIAVYGLSPAPDLAATSLGLRQALTLRSTVSFVKPITAGTAVSYGHVWSAPSDGWLATVPVGYADGVPRVVTNGGEALWNGRRCPIAGWVTMDQMMMFTGDRQPRIGDDVVLLGSQHDEFISVDEWADAAGTISYEIACGISGRVPRVHLG